MRGRTYYDEMGQRTFTLGIVIDITEVEADGGTASCAALTGRSTRLRTTA